jgi:tetratricopeptide (TPR) repeat protein
MNARSAFLAALVMLVVAAWAECPCWAGAQTEENAAPAAGQPALGGLEQYLTPEQLENFLRQAQQRRLTMERNQVAAEIREGLLFDPGKVEVAVTALSDGPKDTFADNAERICRAFALVDARFGKAWDHQVKGSFEAAAGAFKPLISERDSSYLSAAKRFCHAEALAGLGRGEDAVDAYLDLVKAMPDRFSFSALALLRAGKTYEKMNRLYYAMTLYRLWVDSYGVLDGQTARELTEQAERIAADYRDPLNTLGNKMDEVQKRLVQIDSGRLTQQKQREIVAMLDDLIATAEERSSSSSSSQGQQGQKQGQGECSACGGQGCSQCQGQGQGGKSGPAAGIGVPSNPATLSRLVGGAVLRPQAVSEVRPSDPTDDWGRLPPVERQKLLETFKETMPERYREMISDYYKKLAAEPTRR